MLYIKPVEFVGVTGMSVRADTGQLEFYRWKLKHFPTGRAIGLSNVAILVAGKQVGRTAKKDSTAIYQSRFCDIRP